MTRIPKKQLDSTLQVQPTEGAFVDGDKTKLDGIETGAEVNTVDSVNTKTGAVVLNPDDLDDTLTTNKFTTAGDISKLAGIEALADVTDTANVTSAGAIMDGDITGNGVMTRTAAGTYTNRTITGTTNQITVTNGDGVSGNPTLSLPADVIIPTVITAPNTGLHLLDTDASHDLIIKPGSNLTADKTLTITTGDSDMIVDLTAVTDEYVLAYDTATNTWRGVAGGAGGGAATSLNNLASVAINTSLISDTDSTDNLGSSSIYWSNTYTDRLYVNSTAYIDGGTAGQIEISGNLLFGGNITRTGDTNTTLQTSSDQWNFVTGASTRFTINNGGVQVNNGVLTVPTSTPASASATGNTGTITWDSSYIYICTATNTWKRVAIATW